MCVSVFERQKRYQGRREWHKSGKCGIRALPSQYIKGMLTAVRSTSRGRRRIEHLQYRLARLLVPVRAVYDLGLVRLSELRVVLCI